MGELVILFGVLRILSRWTIRCLNRLNFVMISRSLRYEILCDVFVVVSCIDL